MRHSTKDNYLYLTTTPVPRLIVSLAVPTIISMLVTSFYNMADTIIVGRTIDVYALVLMKKKNNGTFW